MDELTAEHFAVLLESAAAADGLAEDEREELCAAFVRLRDNPSLLVGDPSADFTYSDPILAQALWSVRKMLEASPDTMRAGKPGAELKKFWGKWIVVGWKAFWRGRDESLAELYARVPGTKVKVEKDVVRVAVVGDAGRKGIAQDRVLQMIASRHQENAFDAAIHLGDVYDAAGAAEMLRHFLAPFAGIRNAGAQLFTLAGNHDLYFGGEAYDSALKILGQPGRYFAIEAPHWRILCLDTSLAADLPGRHQGKLDPTQLEWFRSEMNQKDRANIVMSHHYYVSAWKASGDELRDQIQDAMAGAFSWYWGHEHVCATYEKGARGFYGACVGNGAFRERWEKPSHFEAGHPSWYAEKRCTCYDKAEEHWAHGFLELELRPDSALEIYHLEGAMHAYERTLRR